ncbi:MFS transporter [Nonomuraea helvata]|uniref:MFS transporter n=1 Tax=Nonomuraea helvata TaxID=37484 RepID=A0ABV5RQS1_9ACTN
MSSIDDDRLDPRLLGVIGVILLGGLLGILNSTMAAVAVGEGPATARLDVVGLALLGPGFAAVVLALSQTAEQGAFTAWQALLPLGVGAALLLAYAVNALRGRSDGRTPPLIDLRLFAGRGFSASVAIMGLGGLALFAALFPLPLYYQQAHGHGVLATGLLMAPIGLGGALAMPLAGRLSDRVGARGSAAGGAIGAGLGALAFTGIGTDTPEIWPALAAFAIGLGSGCFSAPTMGALYRALPPSMVAQGSSVLYMLNQLGAALGAVPEEELARTS